MEVCFIPGSATFLDRTRRPPTRATSVSTNFLGAQMWTRHDRRSCPPRRAAVVTMLFGRGKPKVEMPGQHTTGAEKEVIAEVQASPESAVEVAGKGAAPWSNVPIGKVFFALSLASLAFNFVKTLTGSPQKAPTAASGKKSPETAPPSTPGNGVPIAATTATTTTSPVQPTGRGWAGGRATPSKHTFDSQATDLLQNREKKYILVGGKGGVGKTSMSAALATRFADSGQSTLIISTDPAHSLSDSFNVDLSGGMPMPVVGIDSLYAQEINPEDIKFQLNLLSSSDKKAMMPGMMGDLDMDDLDSLFDTIPPGLDEAVALVEIIKLIQGDPSYGRFDRIVFDTAPTGHTLRLLALPDFMDSFIGKILSMKAKFGSIMNSVKGMLGGGGGDGMDTRELDDLKKAMQVVKDLFQDERQTEFIVATIPNMMAISESVRLIDELRKESIPVNYVFVNQIQPENDHCMFCSTRRKEQQANLAYVERTFKGMKLSKVQFFDREIQGSYALRAMGAQLLQTEQEKLAAKEKAEKAEESVIASGSGAAAATTTPTPATTTAATTTATTTTPTATTAATTATAAASSPSTTTTTGSSAATTTPATSVDSGAAAET